LRGPTQSSFANSSQMQGGMALAQLLKQATLMPTSPLPFQRRAPCPDAVEAVNGLCWRKITPAKLETGFCEDSAFYEPSKGWCQAHMAAYRPFYGDPPRNNNTSGAKAK